MVCVCVCMIVQESIVQRLGGAHTDLHVTRMCESMPCREPHPCVFMAVWFVQRAGTQTALPPRATGPPTEVALPGSTLPFRQVVRIKS